MMWSSPNGALLAAHYKCYQSTDPQGALHGLGVAMYMVEYIRRERRPRGHIANGLNSPRPSGSGDICTSPMSGDTIFLSPSSCLVQVRLIVGIRPSFPRGFLYTTCMYFCVFLCISVYFDVFLYSKTTFMGGLTVEPESFPRVSLRGMRHELSLTLCSTIFSGGESHYYGSSSSIARIST